MISVFLREQKRYTQEDLVKEFHCSEEKTVRILKRLKEYGVLKAVKANDTQKDLTDLLDEDIEIADVEVGENEYLYVFTFVGVITIEGRVLKCYPKYLLDATTPKAELKQVLKVLEKYNSREQIIRMYNDTSDSSAFNMLAVMLFLLQDYFEYGAYTNTQDIIESNGSGDILWDKTINETVVLLSHKKADSYIHIDVEFGEGEGKIPVDSIAKRAEAYKPKEKVTYKMIKEYIEAKYGFKVHTAYIAEVKRNLGLPMYDAPNAVEELKQPRKHPTPEKVEAIKDALRYFAVI